MLSLNCGVESEEEKELWRVQQSLRAAAWAPLHMEISLGGNEGEGVRIREVGGADEGGGGDEGGEVRTKEEGEGDVGESVCAVYDLMMVVGHVREPWMDSPGNLIAHINVGPSYHLMKEVRWQPVPVPTTISLPPYFYRGWQRRSGTFTMTSPSPQFERWGCSC